MNYTFDEILKISLTPLFTKEHDLQRLCSNNNLSEIENIVDIEKGGTDQKIFNVITTTKQKYGKNSADRVLKAALEIFPSNTDLQQFHDVTKVCSFVKTNYNSQELFTTFLKYKFKTGFEYNGISEDTYHFDLASQIYDQGHVHSLMEYVLENIPVDDDDISAVLEKYGSDINSSDNEVTKSLKPIINGNAHPFVKLGALFGASRIEKIEYSEIDVGSWFEDIHWAVFANGGGNHSEYIGSDGKVHWEAWRNKLSISERSPFMTLPGIKEEKAAAIEAALQKLESRLGKRYEIEELDRLGGPNSKMRTIAVRVYIKDRPISHVVLRISNDEPKVGEHIYEYQAYSEFKHTNYEAYATDVADICVPRESAPKESKSIGVAYHIDKLKDREIRTFDELLTSAYSDTAKEFEGTAVSLKVVEQSMKGLIAGIESLTELDGMDSEEEDSSVRDKIIDKKSRKPYKWFASSPEPKVVENVKSQLNKIRETPGFGGTRKTSSLNPEIAVVSSFLDNFDQKMKIKRGWIWKGSIHGDLHQRNLVVSHPIGMFKNDPIGFPKEEELKKNFDEITKGIVTRAIEYRYQYADTKKKSGFQNMSGHWLHDFASLEVSLLQFFFSDHIYLNDVPKVIQLAEQVWSRSESTTRPEDILRTAHGHKDLNGYERAFFALICCIRSWILATADKEDVLTTDVLLKTHKKCESMSETELLKFRKRIILRQYYGVLFLRTINLITYPRSPKASVIGLAAWLARHIDVDHDVSIDV